MPDAIHSVLNGQKLVDLELRKKPNWEICHREELGELVPEENRRTKDSLRLLCPLCRTGPLGHPLPL